MIWKSEHLVFRIKKSMEYSTCLHNTQSLTLTVPAITTIFYPFSRFLGSFQSLPWSHKGTKLSRVFSWYNTLFCIVHLSVCAVCSSYLNKAFGFHWFAPRPKHAHHEWLVLWMRKQSYKLILPVQLQIWSTKDPRINTQKIQREIELNPEKENYGYDVI